MEKFMHKKMVYEISLLLYVTIVLRKFTDKFDFYGILLKGTSSGFAKNCHSGGTVCNLPNLLLKTGW